MRPARSKLDIERCRRPLLPAKDFRKSRGLAGQSRVLISFADSLLAALKRSGAGVCAAASVIVGLALLVACSMPGDAAPIIKVGLIAPFEGLGRPLGYAVLPAVKLALAQANAAGEFGSYRVALVALNDDGEPATSAAQAQALAQDPDILAALAPWGSETAAAAAPVLRQAGIAALAAAPLASAPGMRALCPPPDELAEDLLALAGGPGARPPAVAGPPNALAKALRTAAGFSGSAIAASPTDLAGQTRLYTGTRPAGRMSCGSGGPRVGKGGCWEGRTWRVTGSGNGRARAVKDRWR